MAGWLAGWLLVSTLAATPTCHDRPLLLQGIGHEVLSNSSTHKVLNNLCIIKQTLYLSPAGPINATVQKTSLQSFPAMLFSI
jgi:hypothetical protein